MGRYYNTDTGGSGKFCFALQSSNTPELFGMREDTGSIRYYIDESDFNIELLKELAKKLNVTTEDALKDKDIIFDSSGSELDKCNFLLGLTIYEDVLDDGYCKLEAEI